MRLSVVIFPLVLLSATGCVPLPTQVDLVNNTRFTVEVQLFYHDEQDLPEAIIELDGVELNFVLAPGETQSFSRDCRDLQAIFINDADMLVAPGFSPEEDTGVFREPDDFSCGDSLIFTFSEQNLGTDLAITFSRSD